MNSQGILLFGNDSSAGSASSDYDKDVFQDVSLPASNNTGFSSTVARNPLNGFYANDAAPKWMAKTLFIKDLQRVEDRSLWINGRATYKIIWNEDFPGATGYVYGSISLNGTTESRYVQIGDIGDGVGVSGVIRRVMWLVRPKSGTATATPALDGSNLSAINFGGYTGLGNNFQTVKPTFNAYVTDTSNASHDIHDHRLAADQKSNLEVTGCIVYYDIPGDGVECFGGEVYVDKAKSSPSGATIGYPIGASTFLGGYDAVFLNANGVFGITASFVSGVSSDCSGASGTNLLNVSIGTGTSFPIGTGFFIPISGTTHFLGTVTNVSGDVLTVGPTLPFGFTGTISSLYNSGNSLGISLGRFEEAFNFTPATDFRFPLGVSGAPSESPYSFSDPYLRYRAWGSSLRIVSGASIGGGLSSTQGLFFLNTSSFFNFEGRFSALELEFLIGQSAILSATLCIDGLTIEGISSAIDGPTVVKRTVMTNAGLGYHSLRFNNAGSTNMLLSKVTGYRPKIWNGPTFGLLAQIGVGQTFIQRDSQNASLMAFGNINRVFAESVRASGSGIGSTAIPGPGGRALTTATDGDFIDFQYFGTRFSLLGVPGTSMVYTVNGGATSLSWNAWNGTGLTLGFHDVKVTYKAGTSFAFFGFDYLGNGQVVNQQKFEALPNLSLTNRTFSGPSEPMNARTGDIWEVNVQKGIAYQRLFGGWQLTPAKQIRASYTQATGQTFASAVAGLVNFSTAVYDPMSLVTTGTTWKFVAPVTGYYRYSASVLFVDDTANPTFTLRVNGVALRSVSNKNTAASATRTVPPLVGEVFLSAGSYVDFELTTPGATQYLEPSANFNYVDIALLS